MTVLLALLLACSEPEPELEAQDSVAEPVSCPPAEPWGLAVGEHAEDVAATDCAGVASSLHGLCGQPALVINWYGWCPSCEDNAALARTIAEESPGVAVVVVLDENPLAAPMDAEYCAAYELAHPSPAQVWMDPAKALERYGSTDLVLVLEADGTISFLDQTSSEDAIRAAVVDAADRAG